MGGQGGSAPPNCGSHRSQPFSFTWHSPPLPPNFKTFRQPCKEEESPGQFFNFINSGDHQLFLLCCCTFFLKFFFSFFFFCGTGSLLNQHSTLLGHVLVTEVFPYCCKLFSGRANFFLVFTTSDIRSPWSFSNYVDQDLPNFEPLPPRVDNC